MYMQDAGLKKEDIRKLSKQMELITWDKPSFACLSSRIPYGTRITQEAINQLDQAEYDLINKGFKQVRVRHHGDIARIEVQPEDFSRIIELSQEINLAFQQFGFKYVTLDLQGYLSGSMNKVLKKGALSWM